jgi:hypothetical protein
VQPVNCGTAVTGESAETAQPVMGVTAEGRASVPESRDQVEAREFLEDEIWSRISPEEWGKPITKAEREDILGYGSDGV